MDNILNISSFFYKIAQTDSFFSHIIDNKNDIQKKLPKDVVKIFNYILNIESRLSSDEKMSFQIWLDRELEKADDPKSIIHHSDVATFNDIVKSNVYNDMDEISLDRSYIKVSNYLKGLFLSESLNAFHIQYLIDKGANSDSDLTMSMLNIINMRPSYFINNSSMRDITKLFLNDKKDHQVDRISSFAKMVDKNVTDIESIESIDNAFEFDYIMKMRYEKLSDYDRMRLAKKIKIFHGMLDSQTYMRFISDPNEPIRLVVARAIPLHYLYIMYKTYPTDNMRYILKERNVSDEKIKELDNEIENEKDIPKVFKSRLIRS